MSSSNVRINKRLVELGLASSRRAADTLVQSGQVLLDGQPITQLGTMVSEHDNITVNGQSGQKRADIYVAYYKPKGEICTHVSQAGSKTIFHSLPKTFGSLKIAGRLDKDSEGLLILSSDGGFIQQVSHPSSEKEKEYIVSCSKPIQPQIVKKLVEGVKLNDGMALAKSAKLISGNRLQIVLTQGKKRQLRRMLEAVGYQVVRLERIRIGKYRNDLLKPGQHVFIDPKDVI